MAFKKNEVKFDLASYPHYVVMGQRKVGKTTWFSELVRYVTGSDDGGALITCGKEDGHRAIEGLNYEEVKRWSKKPKEEIEDDDRGFVQSVDDLVENRKTTYKLVQLVGIDTMDELYSIAEKQVFKEHKDLKGQNPKSLNDALGGYGAGKNRLVELVNEQIARLNRAGYAVFILAHTKQKEKEDIFTGQKYEVVTNNLTNDLYGAIADTAQMVVNIITEKEIKDGKIIGTKRYMYFRDNGLVDAGGRFPDLPEKLELSAENFMKAFKQGVQSAKGKALDDKQVEEIKKKEQEELEKSRQRLVEQENTGESDRKDDIITNIRTIIKDKLSENKELAKTINDKMKELGTTLKELSNATLQTLKTLEDWLEKLNTKKDE